MAVKTIKTEVTDSLEDFFDLEPGTTTKEVQVFEPTEIIAPSEYDNKDKELDSQFQEVYDKALGAFEFQMEQADATDLDPKYAGKMADSAAYFLNTALAAAREKAALKGRKDKNATSLKKGASTTTNNTVIVSHNNLLDMLMEEDEKGEIIDGEFGD